MPRKKREKSKTGVYHVMLRGINRQDIFHDHDDYYTMMRVLQDIPLQKDKTGKITGRNDCEIYAFCIMSNHVHILIRELDKDISNLMKALEDRFVIFYNRKYDRVGHLFQDRFRSEPVNDLEYLHTLMRYIHRNPVKSGSCQNPEDYPYSSWREYLPNQIAQLPICKTSVPLHYFPLHELIEWVNMDVDDKCMDMDTENFVNTDQHAWAMISDLTGCSSPEDFKQYSLDYQMDILFQVIDKGVSIRKASRLSLCGYQLIRKRLAQRYDIEDSASVESESSESEGKYKLSERQQQIIEIIKGNKYITVDGISSMLDSSRATIYREVKTINKSLHLFYDKQTKQWYVSE